MQSVGGASGKRRFDMNDEVYKDRFCGQAQVAEDAHANAHAPIVDPNTEAGKVKAIDNLKKEESFAKRHPDLLKALIITSALLLVGILILVAMSKIKSVNNTKTTTGSELGDTAIKTVGTLAVVGGAVGVACSGGFSAYNALKDSHTGGIIDEFRESSMRVALNTQMDLQEIHSNTSKRMAAVNGDNAYNTVEAQGQAIVEAINSGQIPVMSEGIRKSEVFGVCKDHHMHEAVRRYNRRDMLNGQAGTGLNQTRNTEVTMTNGN